MSQEPTTSSSDVLKISTAIHYVRNVYKQRPEAEAINYISRTEASNFNKTDIVNSIDELVKQNVVMTPQQTHQR